MSKYKYSQTPVRFFFLAIGLLLSFMLNTQAVAEPVCGDFLAMSGKKPVTLEFLGCQPDKHHQLRTLRAFYRVAGKNAGDVEKFLVQETGMQPLSFVCCFWESLSRDGRRYGRIRHDQWPAGSSESSDAILSSYEVSMTSEESLIRDRNRWDAIPWFYVQADLFLELP